MKYNLEDIEMFTKFVYWFAKEFEAPLYSSYYMEWIGRFRGDPTIHMDNKRKQHWLNLTEE